MSFTDPYRQVSTQTYNIFKVWHVAQLCESVVSCGWLSSDGSPQLWAMYQIMWEAGGESAQDGILLSGVGWTNGCGRSIRWRWRTLHKNEEREKVNDSSVPDETIWMPVRHQKRQWKYLWHRHHPNPQEWCDPTRPKPTKNATDSQWERQYLLYQANGNKSERE